MSQTVSPGHGPRPLAALVVITVIVVVLVLRPDPVVVGTCGLLLVAATDAVRRLGY
ncbi:hypothetical protein AB0G74_21965 [Streptomyces sp. NPDC020875]|uniref:hypothetical protein n=1 Tax=Streptomyces sp. NPDC020875 TaxID=3154898 RepID=UPI0033EE1C2E